MRRRSGVYQETPGVAHVGQVADDLQVVEQRGSLLGRPFDAEGQYAAETVGQVLLGQIVERTALQTGIVYALDRAIGPFRAHCPPIAVRAARGFRVLAAAGRS